MSLPILLLRPFIFVRHGETFYNLANRVAGSRDVVMTPRGEAQARAARETLAGIVSPHVVSSAHFRARKTARLAMPNAHIRTDARLCERDWGNYQGKPILEKMPYMEEGNGVEPWAAFYTRVVEGLNDAIQSAETAGCTPVVFGHAGVFRAVRMAMQGGLDGQRLPNASPVRLTPPDETQGQWQLETLQPNDWRA